eukprot:gene19426-biopygen22038
MQTRGFRWRADNCHSTPSHFQQDDHEFWRLLALSPWRNACGGGTGLVTRIMKGSQNSGAGVARAWRGRGAGYRPFFWLGWCGRGAGMARAWRACPVTPGIWQNPSKPQ